MSVKHRKSCVAPRGVLTGLALLVAVLSVSAQTKHIRLRNETIRTDPPGAAAREKSAARAEAARSGLWLIQFEEPVRAEWREELRRQGVELLQYVPDDAFVARAVGMTPGEVRRLAYVRWVGPYRADHKLHPRLRPQPGPLAAGAEAVRVLLAPDSTVADVEGARRQLEEPAEPARYPFGAVLGGKTTPAGLGALADSDKVLWIEPAPRMRLWDEVSSAIVAGAGGAPHQTAMMELGYDGAGVTVAVADSGLDSGEIDYMHPDIAGRVKALFYYGGLEDAADEHSHGTHVAGIVAGNGALGEADESGFLYGLGVAPGSSLVAQRIFGGAGNYEPPTSFERLTRDATRAGAEIGSNSWGDDTQGRYDLSAMEFDALVRDADRLRAGDQPYILEFSAGNAGPNPGTVGSPAVGKNVIATGACNSDRRNLPIEELTIYSDGPDTMADFSSRGPCEDGRIKPDVTAPGTWIASLRSVFANDENAWWPISDNYMYQGGTSQAGPQVSGAAAVFVQYYRATHGNATPSPALVKAALINSATDMDNSVETDPAPNMDEGWGRVYLPDLVGSARDYRFLDQTQPLTNGQVFEYRLLVGNPEEPLHITLAYTDVPGFPGAIPALVNDLDLEVVDPNGHVYRGNQFDRGESMADLAATDTINNVEAVRLFTPAPGEYRVRVRAARVAQDSLQASPAVVDQDFALVVSAGLAAPGAGVVAFDRKVYSAPSWIKLSLVDYDLAGQPTATVLLRSGAEPAGETLTLRASTATGVFTASVATATGPAVADGRLQVAHGDLIQAVYQDAQPAGALTYTALADLNPPQIFNVAASNAFGQIVISWETDEETFGMLFYGTNALNLAVTNRSRDVAHEVVLGGAVLNISYQFVIVSEDAAGNRATNDNGGAGFTFTATQPPDLLLVDCYGDYPSPEFPLIAAPPLSGFTDALNQLGVAYDVFDGTYGAVPTLAQLQPYRAVLWRVSDLASPSVTLARAMTNYLAGGGALLISSMEALSRFEEAGLSWFNANVLQVSSFEVDVPVDSITGVPGEPAGANIDTALDYTPYEELILFSDTGYVSDYITLNSPGAPILVSTNEGVGQTVGVRSPKAGYDLPWRVVFLSFPLDTVPLGSGVGNNRAGLLQNILNFLAPQSPAASIGLDSDVYAASARAVVEVEDRDLAGQGPATVICRSPRQPDGIALSLFETPRRGVFRGQLLLSPVSTNAAATLWVASGDTLEAEYLDASEGQTLVATATIETVPPAITAVSVETGYLEAIVSLEISEPSDVLIQYSDSPAVFPDNFTAYDSSLEVYHDVILTGLLPDQTYYFRVVCRDRAGNLATNDNQGQLYTFQTLAPLSVPWQDDLETPSRDWSTYMIEDSETDWTWGVPAGGAPPSGAHCWGSNLGGGPISQSECYLISPGILLTGGNRATLRFQHNYDFSMPMEWDLAHIGAVEIITNFFQQPIPLEQYFDASGGWEEAEVDLTPYMGQVVYLVWYYGLLSFDFLGTPRLGWLVDDISISVDYVAPGTVILTNNIAQAYYSLAGPASLDGGGQWQTITNAPAGRYIVDYGDVAFYQTPPSQTNTLAPGGLIVFEGNYAFPDANQNGISDLWEQQFFGGVSATDPPSALTDRDQDGVSDYAEFVAGTDPTNAVSVLEVAAPIPQGGGSWTLAFSARQGRSYRVLGSQDAVHWTPVTDWQREPEGPAARQVTLPPGSGHYFFRLEVSP